MQQTPTDQTYEQLVNQLHDMNLMFNKFLNDEGYTSTNSGLIPTLNQLVLDMQEIQFTRQVIRFETIDDAYLCLNSIENSDIVYIYNDGNLNGYYNKVLDESNESILVRANLVELFKKSELLLIEDDVDLLINHRHAIDASLKPIILTLPDNPSSGDEIIVFDCNSSFESNNVTITDNNGFDLVLDEDGKYITMIYINDLIKWYIK